ncbi:class I SAM-dependent methyltransferase [Aerosakkonemataceae cyanobacterium BLCC-F50]|uniref:Class I SAM-dependent methyltransferase n=1 Tax=Floridaenema flaviceps BLCC-F50 TaxID=3153642 RepID=A0ABV4Y4D1_9CYAN
MNLTDLLAKKLVKPIHSQTVSGRRVKRLSHHLNTMIPPNQSLLGIDVGCGSGEIARYIQDSNPQLKIVGVDILQRKDAVIDIVKFDGQKLPFEDKSYDFIIIVDVLHHTDNPLILMNECARVSRNFILIKDHICENWWDRVRLRFMDWVGNRAYDVPLPYNYLSVNQWNKLYELSGVVCEQKKHKLNLYSTPFSMIFDSNLHFVAKLLVENK